MAQRMRHIHRISENVMMPNIKFAITSSSYRYLRCISAHASNKDSLLRGVDPEYVDDVARVIELAERARDDWTVLQTPFLPPPVIAQALSTVSRLSECVAVPWGGYTNAERCRLALGREENLAGTDPSSLESVAALQISGNFLFDPATHRDFLGACLGTGIERKFIGDILIQGDIGGQILVVPSMVEHLEFNLTQVRSVPVKTKRIDVSQLRVPVSKVIEINSIEPSLRLDAVASAGFRTSRSKMADMIKSGDVRVNWKGIKKTSLDVAEGDVISCSGKGRVEIKKIGETKKGRYIIEMVRFV